MSPKAGKLHWLPFAMVWDHPNDMRCSYIDPAEGKTPIVTTGEVAADPNGIMMLRVMTCLGPRWIEAAFLMEPQRTRKKAAR